MLKRVLCVLLGILSLVCAGCFGGGVGLTIDESGEVHSRYALLGIDLLREDIEKQKKEIVQNHPNAVVNPIQDGNMSGYSIDLDYKDMDSFAADGIKFFAARRNLCKGIQKKSRWFFDAYSFDLISEGYDRSKQDREDAAMARALLSQVQFDFVLHLPYEADSHNAEHVENNNKTLSWNLASSMISGEDKRIKTTFKLWNKLHIGLTVGAVLLLMIAAVVCAAQASSAEMDEGETKKNIAIAAGGTLCVLALFSAYMLFAPVKFEDSDIISYTLEAAEKPSAAQGSSRPQTSAPKPSQPSAQQRHQSAPQSSAQQNRQSPQPPRRTAVPDLMLANVALGDSFDTVQQVLGTPYKQENKGNGKIYYYYPSVEVHCRNGTVTTLISETPAASTTRGLHEGSSLQDVLSAHGNDYMKSNYDGLDLYEYNFTTPSGRSAILRFAVNANGRVDYISIR